MPQELVELQLMGLEFTLARLTLAAAVVMGPSAEKTMSIAPEQGRQED
ncbi:MAG: hypothetical protein ACOC1U_09630 [Spirochaetota bacterium]